MLRQQTGGKSPRAIWISLLRNNASVAEDGDEVRVGFGALGGVVSARIVLQQVFGIAAGHQVVVVGPGRGAVRQRGFEYFRAQAAARWLDAPVHPVLHIRIAVLIPGKLDILPRRAADVQVVVVHLFGLADELGGVGLVIGLSKKMNSNSYGAIL